MEGWFEMMPAFLESLVVSQTREFEDRMDCRCDGNATSRHVVVLDGSDRRNDRVLFLP